jgi:hypothetical protein
VPGGVAGSTIAVAAGPSSSAIASPMTSEPSGPWRVITPPQSNRGALVRLTVWNMDTPDDDRIPEDLREVARSIRESRTEPTPLRLDELKMRALRQAERSTRDRLFGDVTARWRKKLVATILALGLMLSSGTGLVVAAQTLGSSKKPKLNFAAVKQEVQTPEKDASKSQYCPPSKHDDSDSDTARDRDSDSDCDGTDSDD